MRHCAKDFDGRLPMRCRVVPWIGLRSLAGGQRRQIADSVTNGAKLRAPQQTAKGTKRSAHPENEDPEALLGNAMLRCVVDGDMHVISSGDKSRPSVGDVVPIAVGD
jgi:hypothetical protein